VSARRPSRDHAADLDAARGAASVRDALAYLLAAWRRSPVPELADAICTIPPPDLPAAIGGRRETPRAAWLATARRKLPDELPALLATFLDAGAPHARTRLALLLQWPDDPRRDRALADLIARPPIGAEGALPFWRDVFAAAAQIRDHGAYATIAAARAARRIGRAQVRAAFDGRLDKLRGKLAGRFAAAPPALSPAAGELVAEIAQRWAAPREASGVIDELLRTVHDDPDDDGAREVYADALLERGDPIGKFVGLQLARHRNGGRLDRARSARERALLDAHAERLMGPLAPVVVASSARFERGFLARAKLSGVSCAELAGSPWWSTVRHLENAPAELLVDPALRRLESAVVSVHGGYAAALDTAHRDASPPIVPALAAHGPPGLRKLECRFTIFRDMSRWTEALAALAAARGLPALVELAITRGKQSYFDPTPADYAPLRGGRFLSQLASLALSVSTWGGPDRSLAAWLATLAGLTVPRIELVGIDRFELALAGRYRLHTVHAAHSMNVHRPLDYACVSALESLASTDFADPLRVVLPGPRSHWSDEGWAAMERTLAALPTTVTLA